MTLSARESAVADAIAARADALLDDLRTHVELPTGPGGADAIEDTRERFCARLAALGAERRQIAPGPKPDWLGSPALQPAPTTVCSKLDADTPRVLIAGHLDTVHPADGPFRELIIDPDGRRATGPGVVDMKGGLVIAVAALEALASVGIDGAWSFLLNTDEETGSYHSFDALTDTAKAHDLGIALEPALAGGELAIERVGSGQFMIETRGRSAHVGRAFTEGVSAVTELARCLVRVADMPDPDNGRIISIGPVEGGSATNAVPDRARAWGNVRFATQRVSDELEAMLRDLETEPDAMPAVTVHTSFNRPAKPLTPETQRLADTARAAAQDLGQSLPFASTGGVCDGNIMQHAGLPTIDTMGVRGGGLHTPDEWIELPSLVERCQLLALTLMRIWDARPADAEHARS